MAWFNDESAYYGRGEPVVTQGDIVLAGTVVLTPRPGIAGPTAPELGGERDVTLWRSVSDELPGAPTLGANARWSPAMVLSHPCALEKEWNERVAELLAAGTAQRDAESKANADPSLDRFVAVAPIALYSELAPSRVTGAREGARLGAFPVVGRANQSVPEGWVDFQRVSTIEIDALPLEYRLASLSPLAVGYLRESLALHWAYRDKARIDELEAAIGRTITSVHPLPSAKGKLKIAVLLDDGRTLTLDGSAKPAAPAEAPVRAARRNRR